MEHQINSCAMSQGLSHVLHMCRGRGSCKAAVSHGDQCCPKASHPGRAVSTAASMWLSHCNHAQAVSCCCSCGAPIAAMCRLKEMPP